jgi:hypothetical protein
MALDNINAYRLTTGEPITSVTRALIIPRPAEHGFTVVDQAGAPVVDALTFRKSSLNICTFVDRAQPLETVRLKGRYLFAGDYWAHFGHFLFESLARLWALDHLDVPLDGIIFYAPRGRGTLDPASVQAQILATLGIDLPIYLVSKPTEVDELLVPRQACGLGGLASGTPAARAFFQNRLRRVPPKAGVERLYLSRLGYRLRRGGMFAEQVLQRNLERQGYVAYMPERHSIQDQIATYLGAEKIVAPDSSALHMFGFVGRPEQDLAIVLRRTEGATDILPQVTGFTGRMPLVIDRINRIWARENYKNPSWGSFAEIDFAKLGQDLCDAGFIDNLDAWETPKGWQWQKIRNSAALQLRNTFVECPVVRAA